MLQLALLGVVIVVTLVLIATLILIAYQIVALGIDGERIQHPDEKEDE